MSVQTRAVVIRGLLLLLASASIPAWAVTTKVVTEVEVFAEPNQQTNIEPLVIEPSVAETEALPSFVDGTSLVLKPRTYYLHRSRDDSQDSKAWALGGELAYKSGWLKQHLALAASFYTSQKLYGPEEYDGTQLLLPGQEPINVLGEFNLTWRFAEHHGVRIGRQRFDLPYMGSHDVRMIPNTFEAIAVGNTSTTGFAYMAGFVDKIKQKNSDKFIYMSEAAEVEGIDKGLAFAGARYKTEGGTLFGGLYQRTMDVFDTFFTKVEHPLQLGETIALKACLQYTQQKGQADGPIGNHHRGDFETSMLAGKLELSQGPLTFHIAASTTDEEASIFKPYNNAANYLSVMLEDFDRAGEDALLFGLSYDFQRVGVGDLSMFTNVVDGNTPDSGISASPDETEYDFTVDYRIKEGPLDRVWFRVRGAFVDQEEDQGGEDFFDIRIIVNYDFNLI